MGAMPIFNTIFLALLARDGQIFNLFSEVFQPIFDKKEEGCRYKNRML